MVSRNCTLKYKWRFKVTKFVPFKIIIEKKTTLWKKCLTLSVKLKFTRADAISNVHVNISN